MSLVQHAEQYSETHVSKEAEHRIPSLGFLEQHQHQRPRSCPVWSGPSHCHTAVPLPRYGPEALSSQAGLYLMYEWDVCA